MTKRRRQPSKTRPPANQTKSSVAAAARSRVRPVGRSPSPLTRHAVVAVVAAVVLWAFWASRPRWDAEMRLWKAFGDTAFVLLLVTLALGPLARLVRTATRFLRWRRQFGIWFAIVAGIHGTLVIHGWARWSLRRFLGYEVVPQLGREVRLEPGFGLSNLIGLVALVFALVLAATSSDRAVRRLGVASWKWLHHSALFVFYLSLLHAGYFLFLHYTMSFHKAVPAPDWFRLPFVVLGGALVVLQVAAFVRTAGRAAGRPSARTQLDGSV